MVEIRVRSSWGPRGPDGDASIGIATQGAIIHHSVTATLPETASEADEAAQVRHIEGIGISRFGFGSYHVVVFNSGRAWQMTSWGRRGAHAAGLNSTTRGLVVAGNFEAAQPSGAAINTLAQIIAAGRGQWLTATAPVRGHRDVSATACPGRHLYARLDEIRAGGSGGDDDMTPEQAALLNSTAQGVSEVRRILAVMMDAIGAGTDQEANYVIRQRELHHNVGENRRMLGVILGWQPPQGPEVEARERLWGET